MQYDDASGTQDDTANSNSNGNGSRNMDVDDVDRGNDGHNNERIRNNPFSNRNRSNFNNDGYGIRDSPAIIVNTNLLPFIQRLRDPLRKQIESIDLFNLQIFSHFFSSYF